MSEKSAENRRNFTTIRKQFLRHLSTNNNVTELSKDFGAINSNFERVNFVINLLQSSKIKADFQIECKSDEIAVKLREQGNEMYKIKKVKEAWEFYTKSICYADENSVNLGLAYANRSAVLFELDLHKQCSEDISRALGHNYPDHLKSKLFVREKNSKNLETEAFKAPHEEVPNILNKNPNIQCADSCLEICEEKDWGRFVVATRDIKIGEILAVEQPFVVLLVDELLSHCHECISLCYNLIPCKSCVHALYCSESCREKAFEKYHKYECPILATIKYLELDKLKVLPLKIAFLVRDHYNTLEAILNDSSDVYRSDNYKEIHELIANTEQRSVPDLFERAIGAAILFNLVEEHTKFFEGADENFKNVFKDIVLLHLQTGPSNFHEITELAPDSGGTYEPEEIGGGAFAFLSLLNHSCTPNVTRFCYGSSIVLRAIQNIRKGEQCFDNYGYHYAVLDKNERQKQLQTQYYFDCVCPACENDWSSYNELPATDDNVDIDEELFSKLSCGDVETAKVVVESLLSRFDDLQDKQPCKGFCKVQEVVKRCFAVLGNKRKIF